MVAPMTSAVVSHILMGPYASERECVVVNQHITP